MPAHGSSQELREHAVGSANSRVDQVPAIALVTGEDFIAAFTREHDFDLGRG